MALHTRTQTDPRKVPMSNSTRTPDNAVLIEGLAAEAVALRGRLLGHYRALHEIPELGFEEHETSRYLREQMERFGLEPEQVAGTGLVAELPGGGDGPTVMVRADMDALPVVEHRSNSPRSRNPGRMHACGHDGHMAIVLTLAEVFARVGKLGKLSGRVVVLFQPSEESVDGAARVVAEGVLDRFAVDRVIGLHLWSALPLGQATIPDGPVMGSTDRFRIVLRGRGGHGAQPHEALDPIVAASNLVVALQQMVAREVDPLKPSVLTVGTLQAGSAPNVIPESAELAGTFRAAEPEIRRHLQQRTREVAQAVARMHRMEADIVLDHGNPPTLNDPRIAGLMRQAAREVLGREPGRSGPATLGAEDFALYLAERPGAFVLLGMRDEENGAMFPHHNSRFKVAEGALPIGVDLLLHGAIRIMEAGSTP